MTPAVCCATTSEVIVALRKLEARSNTRVFPAHGTITKARSEKMVAHWFRGATHGTIPAHVSRSHRLDAREW